MSVIARVIVEIGLNREFDYVVPAELAGQVYAGSRVVVPFGRSKRTGYVVSLSDRSDRNDLKPIFSLSGAAPLISERIIELCRWMADYYCAPIEHAVRTALPAPVRKKGQEGKTALFVELIEHTDGGDDKEVELGRSPKQAAAMDVLREQGAMTLADLARSAGTGQSVIRALEKKGLVRIVSKPVSAFGAEHIIELLPTQPLTLMSEQASALELVCKSIDTLVPSTVLLHGVTGSGKTEVYLQAIAHVLSQQRDAIVLVPEISLTPQTVDRFRGRFGENVAVLHSHQSEGERHEEWHRIRKGEARIGVGARSAVFAPFRNLGLIVVDEEHDTSYKQDEAPRYNARDVAVMRGRMEQCAVLLGSATPSAESYVNSITGKYERTELLHRADHRSMPAVRVVDMRMESDKEGRGRVFSEELIKAMRDRLEKAEQTILFLNRRGYATSLVCPKCGFVAECRNCSVAFTYHRQDEELRCHICGAGRKVPRVCPECSDPAFKYSGLGTQRVESIVRKIFPQANIQRMDSDVTRRRHSHRTILGDFRTGKIDILIGTQMIAKGLDFPNVTLIGVVNADLSLHVPDFRAGERTFQLLTQVAGRAGRGDIPGEVVVQTFTPLHLAVQSARRMDYRGFYEEELEFRKELNYPPFAHLVCLTVQGTEEEAVKFGIEGFAKKLQAALPGTVVFAGPVPAPLARAKGRYRYQLMMRCKSVKAMTHPLRAVLGSFKWPQKVTYAIDVDAVSLM